MSRKGRLVFAFGENGTGKTTFIKEVCLKFNTRNLIVPANAMDPAWNDTKKFPRVKIAEIVRKTLGFEMRDLYLLQKEKHRDKFIALGMELQKFLRGFSGNVVLPIAAGQDALFDIVIDQEWGMRDGGLVIDDFRTYIKGANLKANVTQFASEIRHRSLDAFLCTHGPDRVPPALFNYRCDFILFKTNKSFEGMRSKGVWTEEMLESVEAVRRRVNSVAAQAERNNPDDPRHYYKEKLEITEGQG